MEFLSPDLRKCSLDKTHFQTWFIGVDSLCPCQQFFSHVGKFAVFLGLTSTKQTIKCFAKGHNRGSLMSLKLATLQSKVIPSTT